ncbi:hypothetical protein B0H65DRAFT_548731 [Neurospora tetraspora]|uniref:Uncharacterized protein n=1 Tax=Neurospora tetraspora TaxID=94610 RepID=A0AAE0JEP3_9PEZI|nr:hypothetical protein B0H65DRAFT_548731 [Neurospora tetraspora]
MISADSQPRRLRPQLPHEEKAQKAAMVAQEGTTTVASTTRFNFDSNGFDCDREGSDDDDFDNAGFDNANFDNDDLLADQEVWDVIVEAADEKEIDEVAREKEIDDWEYITYVQLEKALQAVRTLRALRAQDVNLWLIAIEKQKASLDSTVTIMTNKDLHRLLAIARSVTILQRRIFPSWDEENCPEG